MLLEPAVAAELLLKAFDRDPELGHGQSDPREARLLLARSLLETDRPEQAEQPLERILESGPDAEGLWLLSRALLREGKTTEARAALDQSLKLKPGDPLAAQPAPYLGAARCRPCHPREFQSQQRSHHALTIRFGRDLMALPWPDKPVADTDNPGATQTVVRTPDKVEIETKVESQLFSAVVEYAMGSNHHGRSFVVMTGKARHRASDCLSILQPRSGAGRRNILKRPPITLVTWGGLSPTNRCVAASTAIPRISRPSSILRADRKPVTTESAASDVTGRPGITSGPWKRGFPTWQSPDRKSPTPLRLSHCAPSATRRRTRLPRISPATSDSRPQHFPKAAAIAKAALSVV